MLTKTAARCLFLSIVFFFLPSLWAQNDASLTGIVQDNTGAVIPQAIVKLTSQAQGTARSVLTNGSGAYEFPFLAAGNYDIEVTAQGFKTVTRKDMNMAVAQNVRSDFNLEVGSVSENINVSAAAEMLNTDSAEVGAVVDNTRVVEMPLNGRTFYSLAILAPNVMPPAQGSSLSYRGGINVAGSAETANNFNINGLPDTDFVTQQPQFRPSIDAIQEFNILTGIYGAQYGLMSGGQVVVTLKAGGNEIHGDAFEFLRNQDIMSAKNFFALPGPVPVFKRNQFGGTVGGPIRKNKTFFFYGYEGLRLSQAVTNISTVPTAAMDAGIFSATPIVLRDPTTNTPLAGDFIPASRINPVGKALNAFYPVPTSLTAAGLLPANNFTQQEIRTENSNTDSLKIDHQFSTNDSMYVTANWSNDPSYEPSNLTCGSRVTPGFGCYQGNRAQLYGISETHIFNASMVNEFRVGFTDLIQPRIQENASNFWGQFGLSAVSESFPLPTGGAPTTTVTGYATFGTPTNIPQRRDDWTFILSDNFSWTRGKHTLKFGGGLNQYYENNWQSVNIEGSIGFTNTSTGPTSGNAVGDMLFGLPASSSNTPYQATTPIHEKNISAFVQDDYKVSNNLTLNIGLRWEANTPPILIDRQMTSFNPVTGQPTVQSNPAPFTVPGVTAPIGFGTEPFHYDLKDFAPRLGVAWQPGHDGKTVVRLGAGSFYNASYNAYNYMTGYPYKIPYNYTSSVAQPLSLSNPFPSANAVINVSLYGWDQNFKNAVAWEWSGGIQRQLTNSMTLELNYFGSSNSHIWSTNQNINQPAPGPGTPTQVNARRPYPAWSTVDWIQWDRNAHFESGVVKLTKRYSAGLSWLIGFTWSKSIDDVGSLTNAYNFNTARGLSSFNTPFRLVMSPVYELPFGKGKPFLSNGFISQIVGGWQISSLIQWQTGTPLTPTLSGNYSNSGGTTDRPDLTCNPNTNAPHLPTEWFNTSCFALRPASGAAGATYSFGNAGVGTIQGPGYVDIDTSLVRTFSVKEKIKVQFRMEIYDLFNHPNFSGTGNGATTTDVTVTDATFGHILAAADPREAQLALKVLF